MFLEFANSFHACTIMRRLTAFPTGITAATAAATFASATTHPSATPRPAATAMKILPRKDNSRHADFLTFNLPAVLRFFDFFDV
jgi:hypothetical protein